MSVTPSREDRELLIELAQLGLFVELETQDLGEEDRERAIMLAEQFVERCGFDNKDSDRNGYEMGELVVPRLAQVFLMIGLDNVQEAENS